MGGFGGRKGRRKMMKFSFKSKKFYKANSVRSGTAVNGVCEHALLKTHCSMRQDRCTETIPYDPLIWESKKCCSRSGEKTGSEEKLG